MAQSSLCAVKIMCRSDFSGQDLLSETNNCCNDNPIPVICKTQFPNSATLLYLQLPPWASRQQPLLPQLLIYSSIKPCSNHLHIPKMATEVKKIRFDLPTYSAMLGSHILENWLLKSNYDFVIFESPVIVGILFFRFISIPYRAIDNSVCYEWWWHPQIYMSDKYLEMRPLTFYVTGFSKGAKVKYEWRGIYSKSCVHKLYSTWQDEHPGRYRIRIKKCGIIVSIFIRKLHIFLLYVLYNYSSSSNICIFSITI